MTKSIRSVSPGDQRVLAATGPVDLQAEFGHRWLVIADPAAGGRSTDPWNLVVPCRHGHLFPFGDGMVAAATSRPGVIVRKLLAIPGAVQVADGDDGANIAFPVDRIRDVARVMKPRSARPATPQQRAALARGRLRARPPS